MVNTKKIKRELKLQKEGIIGGGIVGFLVALISNSQGKINEALDLAAQSQGLIDTTLQGTISNIPFVKVAVIFVFVGMTVGYFLDKNFKPRK